MDTKELLEAINNNGEIAYELLCEADKGFESRFKRLNTTMMKLLEDVREHFPDAYYYAEDGGFLLVLGEGHYCGEARGELIALSGNARVEGGGF